MRLNRLVEVAGRDGEAEMLQKHPNLVVRRRKVNLLRERRPQIGADSDLIRPPIPTRSRPGFRFDVGHRSDLKPATIPR